MHLDIFITCGSFIELTAETSKGLLPISGALLFSYSFVIVLADVFSIVICFLVSGYIIEYVIRRISKDMPVFAISIHCTCIKIGQVLILYD
jgi:hypothetical protein